MSRPTQHISLLSGKARSLANILGSISDFLLRGSQYRIVHTAWFTSRRKIESGTQVRRSVLVCCFLFFMMCGLSLSLGAGKVAAEDVFKDVCEKAPTSAACLDSKTVSGHDPKDTKNDKNPLFGPNGVLTTVVNVVSILVGIAAVVSIMVAGVKFITSGSNPQDVSNARELVIYALVALFVVAFSQIIVRFFLNKVF